MSDQDVPVIISAQAYCKLIMHSIRYQHDPLSGILLVKRTSGNDTALPLEIVDAIPFFHTASSANLSPPLMIALSLVEAHCSEKGDTLCIGGYYFANELLHDNSIPPSAQRVADRIVEQLPNACLVMIKNDMLKLDLIDPAVQIWQRSSRGSFRSSASWDPLPDPASAVSDTVRSVACKLCNNAELVSSLVDLDAHLDSRPPTGAEVSSGAAAAKAGESAEGDENGDLGDWRNPVIARAVEKCLKQYLRRQGESEGETETEPESAPTGAN